jgi:hypothetical protein
VIRTKLQDKWNISSNDLRKIFYLEDDEAESCLLCTLCRKQVRKGVIPTLCLADGLDFPKQPQCLKDITRLEEWLIAPRHIFHSIWTVQGARGQFRSKGGIVNVPVNVDTTVSCLPRRLDDSHVTHLNLVRRLQYKKDYIKGIISPAKVWQAASYLVNKRLYTSYDINLDENWLLDALNQVAQYNEDDEASVEETDGNMRLF